jgi:hypothetical protein
LTFLKVQEPNSSVERTRPKYCFRNNNNKCQSFREEEKM